MNRFEITTDRLVLKPLGPELLDTANEYALDIRNTRYMCFLPNRDSDETLDFLRRADEEWNKEKPAYSEFAMFLQDKHIGAVSVYFDDGKAELGWIVNRRYWGNGFAYEAARALVEYFSDNAGTEHFIAHCDTENAPSIRVMEKLGLTRTGINSGRRNRSASRDSSEYQYELLLPKKTRPDQGHGTANNAPAMHNRLFM